MSASERWTRREIVIVLALSLGQSAVYSIVSLVARLTAPTALGDQSTTINSSMSDRPWLDLTYQLLAIGFALVPMLLALYLLGVAGRAPRAIGFDLTRPWRDAWHGVGLAALIGVPGIGLYVLGRALGITVEIQAATLNALWWTMPILILRAVMNALLEEVIVVGYLTTRLRDLRWSTPAILLASSLLRGTYHLYQGIGPFIGNVAMGLIFTGYFLWRKGGRIMPLVVAHTILDVVAFAGYQFLPDSWLAALGIS
ncbi:CPBP family intramembrane metalloprotease [Rarobacter faecitabidus]|uniref:CAAX prenyl protease-like protein n=1 Tax=Rarobacter faecitabidus TaxID=13243 RepID=A0A542ZPA0_RARFA|nr:CPBP family intramembrane glutamic endopeptidase [Rarobacter faecitabidus]TQL62147.1 CAAX prenyl protease-like protein [Rarobacter faecitabidus]